MSALQWSLHALRTFPATLQTCVADVPHDALDWRPPSWEGIPSELLTIRQQICHLRDIEADGYLVRFRRLLDETNPTLESIDTYALIEPRGYDGTNVDRAFADFSAARTQTLQMLDALKPNELQRRGQFEGYGAVTVASLIHYLCSHDQQHLAGIQWLLGARTAQSQET